MRKIQLGLLSRIIIAILIGVICGNFLPLPLIRIFATFNVLFSEFLSFSIPLIILGLVTVAISDIGNKAGKLLLLRPPYHYKQMTSYRFYLLPALKELYNIRHYLQDKPTRYPLIE